jgi:hypothetical protein
MGVGVPGGCEKILHWANSLLLDPDNPRFAFQSDWAAAFQNVERGKMFETLGARKELDRLAIPVYQVELQLRFANLLPRLRRTVHRPPPRLAQGRTTGRPPRPPPLRSRGAFHTRGGRAVRP